MSDFSRIDLFFGAQLPSFHELIFWLIVDPGSLESTNICEKSFSFLLPAWGEVTQLLEEGLLGKGGRLKPTGDSNSGRLRPNSDFLTRRRETISVP
jgi:hypothetical protein